ncbi:MAG TPA: hypothetical protein VK625_12440 [Flavitalea sp.]|nr:hypothetical protein [Flavitalea sp.]
MFENVVIDVFLGLIFIFLLYSLLASIIQELIANRFCLRSRMLQKAIRRMLEDHVSPSGNWFQRSTFYNYFGELVENIRRFFKPFRDHETMVKRFYDQPAIKYLGEDKSFSKPSYLLPHNFSNTIVQLLRGPHYDGSTQHESDLIKDALENNTLNINGETLSQFKNLFADARQDALEFRTRLELWFDETMQRTQGWYKRQTQTMLVLFGFALAVIFNIDTIAITKILSKDKKAREQMVEMALSKKNDYGNIINPGDSTISQQAVKNYDSVFRILTADAAASQSIFGLKDVANNPSTANYQRSFPLKVAGWIITALAISLGAPFWFDLLNKVSSLRTTGTRVPAGNAANSQVQGRLPVNSPSGKKIRG